MDLVTSSRGESLPVGQASEIQLRIQVGSPYPHTIVHTVYDSTKRCEAQQADDRARRPREMSSTVRAPQLRGCLCLPIRIQQPSSYTRRRHIRTWSVSSCRQGAGMGAR